MLFIRLKSIVHPSRTKINPKIPIGNKAEIMIALKKPAITISLFVLYTLPKRISSILYPLGIKIGCCGVVIGVTGTGAGITDGGVGIAGFIGGALKIVDCVRSTAVDVK